MDKITARGTRSNRPSSSSCYFQGDTRVGEHMCKCRHFHDPPSGQDTHSAPPGMNIREGAGPFHRQGKRFDGESQKASMSLLDQSPCASLVQGTGRPLERRREPLTARLLTAADKLLFFKVHTSTGFPWTLYFQDSTDSLTATGKTAVAELPQKMDMSPRSLDSALAPRP